MGRNGCRGVWAVAAGLVVSSSARAQEALYLVPRAWSATVGENLSLSTLVRAPDAERPTPAPWPERIAWFFVRVAGTQENRDAVEPAPDEAGARAAVVWPAAHAGVTLVGLDAAEEIVTIASESLSRVAGAAGDATLAERFARSTAPEARVLLCRSAKTLITVRDGAGAVAREAQPATSKSGQRVEIRPLFDPTLARVGSDVAVRVYAGVEEARGARVRATCEATGRTQEFTTDAKGIGLFHVEQAGAWRVEFTRVRAPIGEEAGEWVFESATLTFEAPAGEARP